ncbi:UDP-N-acetylmuramyl-tripeptide synthetase [Candidatus Falkowbacteria bacterium]|nr:UDP-N-acetylmuramyl-tripeptide synthetase [Candidatus Falkowbacteria bacterium]
MNIILNTVKRIIPKKIFASLQPKYHYALSWLAAFIYRNPSDKLIVIGVTGTTGKTTSTYLIAKTLSGLGYKVGFTSTAMLGDGQKEWLNDKKMTMPGRLFVQSMLSRMVKNGCQYAIVETTSEGIRQFRHRFINYDILVFTGLYPEHIESHGGFDNYKAAKGKLFEHLKNCKVKYVDLEKKIADTSNSLKKLDLERVKKTSIYNLDDEHVEYFAKFWSEEKIGFTQHDLASSRELEVLKYDHIESKQSGLSFQVDSTKFNLKIVGAFNAANAMTAVAVAKAQGKELSRIKASLERVTGIPGRLERIDAGQPFTVVVDYAFEPNAVEKLYETVGLIPHSRKIHVLGAAGGGRDTSRRPILGRIAGEQADVVIVTNEDPYDENPEIIADQVIVGAEKAGKIMGDNLFKVMDRRTAINKALSLAENNDIVLITGKGSEQGIVLAHGRIEPWDDRKVVREELKSLKSKD